MNNTQIHKLQKSTRQTTVLAESSVRDAVRWMAQSGVDFALVESNDVLQGIFTGYDLVDRVVGAGKNPAEVKVEEVMTKDVVTLPESATALEAIALMDRSGFHHLPIINKKRKVVGLLSALDLLRSRVGELEQDNKCLNAFAEVDGMGRD